MGRRQAQFSPRLPESREIAISLEFALLAQSALELR